ncbi:hypothetical protein [Clostridium neonatale]
MVKYIDGQFGVYGANASLQTEMLKILNAENVAEKGGTLSTENLISLNPDAIVYVHADKMQVLIKMPLSHFYQMI